VRRTCSGGGVQPEAVESRAEEGRRRCGGGAASRRGGGQAPARAPMTRQLGQCRGRGAWNEGDGGRARGRVSAVSTGGGSAEVRASVASGGGPRLAGEDGV
jgi:hypothetical protein